MVKYNSNEDSISSYDSYELEELKEWEKVDAAEAKRIADEQAEEEKNYEKYYGKQNKFVSTMRDMMADEGYDTKHVNLLKS